MPSESGKKRVSGWLKKKPSRWVKQKKEYGFGKSKAKKKKEPQVGIFVPPKAKKILEIFEK